VFLLRRRTYARVVPTTGQYEEWWQTVERVVNGCYNMQRGWIEQHGLGWNARRAQRSAQEMYSRIFSMKFLPPGRGLWAMGSPITEEKRLYAALNNCAFVSTETMRADGASKPFAFLMDAAMLGVGVGFDTKGAGTVTVRGPAADKPAVPVRIADSREGWVASVRMLLDAHFGGQPDLDFDYSGIRPPGEPIKGFGGVSSGPDALIGLHERIRSVLVPLAGRELTVTAIVDIMNLIGQCVVSGNVRQTAEIAFGDPDCDEYVDLKNYAVNPHRAAFGWTSNNSVFARLGMDYGPVCERVAANGEPGFAWLDNMRAYGRMGGVADHRDARASGGNPCLEQTLESYEMCCLVESFPANHDSLDDFKRTLKFAFLYAKTVTLGQTHWPEVNRVTLRNRRIGCSMSGIAQFIAKHGIEELRVWCDEGCVVVVDPVFLCFVFLCFVFFLIFFFFSLLTKV
jgi:ribonucleoside-triphosphate reductase